MKLLWKTVCRLFPKLKIGLPFDSATPLLGIYPEKTKTLISNETCTPTMFRAALHMTATTWKQPKCQSIDEWIKKMWYTHNGILLSHIKGWNNTICSNMQGPKDYHTKWSHTEKDRYHMTSFICRILKIVQMNLFMKQKNSHRKQTYGYQRGRKRKHNWKHGTNRCIPLYTK